MTHTLRILLMTAMALTVACGGPDLEKVPDRPDDCTAVQKRPDGSIRDIYIGEPGTVHRITGTWVYTPADGCIHALSATIDDEDNVEACVDYIDAMCADKLGGE